MSEYCVRHEITKTCDNVENYLFTCSIPCVSSIKDLTIDTGEIKMAKSRYFKVKLTVNNDSIALRMTSNSDSWKCFVSMHMGLEMLLSKEVELTYHSYDSYYDLILTSKDESYRKLKQHPNDALVITCRITSDTRYTSTVVLNNLQKLSAAFEYSAVLMKEKVILRVGEETETVNKAILCARSPVFRKMFESNMKETINNTVIIEDINMPVMKVLVSFLYSGKLENCDFDFLCDLYCAAHKYDIYDLQAQCVDLLLPKISLENVFRILKLAFTYNIQRLKLPAMTVVAGKIDIWVSSSDWKNLLEDDPEIAAVIIKFLNLRKL